MQNGVTLPAPAQAGTSTSGAWEGIGVLPASLSSGSSVYLIQDDGDVTWYNDGDSSKSGLTSQYMKFLGDTVTWQ